MKLTRRGRVVVAGLAVGFIWAAIFGIQAMNAVLLPGAVAFLTGWWLVRRAGATEIAREPIEHAYPDQPRRVAVRVSGPRALAATVIDELPRGVRVVGDREEHLVSGGRASYEVTADSRGVVELGPARVRLMGPFGLVAETIIGDERVNLVTYPLVREVLGLDRRRNLLPEGGLTADRHEFDRLREYDRGDAPRDIDWKSSAKRAADPLIVKEFVADTEAGDVRIVAESDPGEADEMAEAAASIATHLLDKGVAVGLRTADQTVGIAAGGTQRTEILHALARTNGGRVEPAVRAHASIHIESVDGEVTLRLGSGTVAFDELKRPSPPRGSEDPAVADGGWTS